VLATALFDRPAFRTCIAHGTVLVDDGRKMSKSLRNYPDVSEVFDRDGADAMRWFLMSSPVLRGGNLVVTEQGIRDGVRQVLLPLWNTWYFFTLYANAAGYTARWRTDSTDLMDRYLLAKLHDAVVEVTAELDAADVAGACQSVRDMLDVLTNWYVRRSRMRFWDGDSPGAHDAFDTLYTALEVLTRLAAPLLPLVTEDIWRGLTDGRSVHLADWPSADDLPADPGLVAGMDRAREVCSAALGMRKAQGLRVRLPLPELVVVDDDPAVLQPYTGLVGDEVNVRSVRLVALDQAADAEFGISQKLTVNARAAGPRLGRDVQVAIGASKSGDWSVSPDGSVVAGGIALVEGEYTLDLAVTGGAAGGGVGGADGAAKSALTVLPRGGFAVLDTAVTPALAAEGLARDVIRVVQRRSGRRSSPTATWSSPRPWPTPSAPPAPWTSYRSGTAWWRRPSETASGCGSWWSA
jgi:isoleucyl-tRNA synthetase